MNVIIDTNKGDSMAKIIPNKTAIEDSYHLFEHILREISDEQRPFFVLRLLMYLMDGPKSRQEVAEFLDRTSPRYKERGAQEDRSNMYTLTNVSRVAKRLHKADMIRIIYDHPLHDSPCNKKGKMRPGVEVTYQLSQSTAEFIRGWLYRCFMSHEGVFYDHETQSGELKQDDDNYWIENIDENGKIKKIRMK